MSKQNLLSMVALVVLITIGLLFIRSTTSHAVLSRTAPKPQVDSHEGRPMAAIEGRVVSPEGKPVVGAEVSVEKASNAMARTLPTAVTSRNGEFKIEHLRPGTYVVHAAKRDEGYANTHSNFLRGDDSTGEPQVNVYDGQITRDVVVQLLPKVGMIIGLIVDATNNAPLDTAHVTLRHVNNPENFFTSSTNALLRAFAGYYTQKRAAR